MRGYPFSLCFLPLSLLFFLLWRTLHQPGDEESVASMYSREKLEASLLLDAVPQFQAQAVSDAVLFKPGVFFQEPVYIVDILRRVHRAGAVQEHPAGLHIPLYTA